MKTAKATTRMLKAADLSADGMRQVDIAAQLGVSQGTVSEWLKRDDLKQAMVDRLRSAATPLVARAIHRLSQQVDSENEWIAQSAAREILARFAPYVLGESDSTITVQLIGLPELGTPPPISVNDSSVE